MIISEDHFAPIKALEKYYPNQTYRDKIFCTFDHVFIWDFFNSNDGGPFNTSFPMTRLNEFDFESSYIHQDCIDGVGIKIEHQNNGVDFTVDKFGKIYNDANYFTTGEAYYIRNKNVKEFKQLITFYALKLGGSIVHIDMYNFKKRDGCKITEEKQAQD